jgi:glycosyltransferase involved in cell wall biosynthesis
MRRDFDVVHCWDEPFNPLCAQIARLSPKHSAFTFYTFQNISKRYPPPFAQLEQYTLRRADGWIAAGALVESTLGSRDGYRDRPHRVLGLGVDVNEFSPDEAIGRAVREELAWGNAEGGPIVVFVGRFTVEKGVRIMMAALEQIDVPWRALFIGSGELESEIETWSTARPGQVAMRRNLTHGQVARYLKGCDILCAPSQTTPIWKEQFGRMLIEAFASGVAVVTSDSGEIPNVVADAAIVVPESDEARWLTELRAIISDPIRRAEYADRGLERVRTKFAWSVLAQQHLEFFEELSDSRATES